MNAVAVYNYADKITFASGDILTNSEIRVAYIDTFLVISHRGQLQKLWRTYLRAVELKKVEFSKISRTLIGHF